MQEFEFLDDFGFFQDPFKYQGMTGFCNRVVCVFKRGDIKSSREVPNRYIDRVKLMAAPPCQEVELFSCGNIVADISHKVDYLINGVRFSSGLVNSVGKLKGIKFVETRPFPLMNALHLVFTYDNGYGILAGKFLLPTVNLTPNYERKDFKGSQ